MKIIWKYFMKCICMKFNAITCIHILRIFMSQWHSYIFIIILYISLCVEGPW